MGAQNIVLTAAQKAAGATELIGIDSSGNIKDTPARVAAFKASVSGYDFADQGAGQPATTKNGAAIAYRSNGAPVVASGGFLTSSAGTGSRAWYAERKMPNGCRRIGAEFKFSAGTTGRNGGIALILWSGTVTDTANVPPTPAHFVINRWGWQLGTSPTQNGTITNYASGRFNKALSVGSVYSAEMCVDRGVAYLRLPDGTTAIASHSALTSMIGTNPGWEFYQFDGAVDDFVSIGRVWMSDADQSAAGGPAEMAALLDIPRRPTAISLTSIASSSIATADTIIDAAAVCPVYSGPSSGNANVLCRLTVWATLSAGRSLIFSPKFVDIDGAVVSQPYAFACTAPSGGYSGYVTLEFVQAVGSAKPVNCEFRAFSTGSGDTYTVAANKPLTMSFVPLG